MGCRLHKVSKYEVKYEDDCRFNWQQTNVTDTFNAYDACVYGVEDENGCGMIEIYEEDYKAFLERLEADKGAKCTIEEYTPEEVIEWFKSAPICSDGMVRFCWF